MKNYYKQFLLCLSEVIQGAEGVRQSCDDDRDDREKRRQREEEEMEEDIPNISQQEDDLDVCAWCTYDNYYHYCDLYLFKVTSLLTVLFVCESIM